MIENDKNGINTGRAYDIFLKSYQENNETNIMVIDPKVEVDHNMNNSVYFAPKDFSVMVDDNTLEFVSPVVDSQGMKGSAQIKVFTDGTLLKDNKERFSADERSVIWSNDIDAFAIEKFNGTQNLADQLLTTVAVSTILGISKSQIHQYVKQGKLKPVICNQGGNWFIKEDIIHYLTRKIEQLQFTVKRVEEYKE